MVQRPVDEIEKACTHVTEGLPAPAEGQQADSPQLLLERGVMLRFRLAVLALELGGFCYFCARDQVLRGTP
jgi:hypothetical protein